MDLQKLKSELATDPVAMGYSGKTTDQIVTLINDPTKRTIDRTIVPAYEVINATVPAEWAALTADEKTRYSTLTGAGALDVTNANVRAAFAAMFGAGTTTRTALVALQTRTGSRADELGLGPVTRQDVIDAQAA